MPAAHRTAHHISHLVREEKAQQAAYLRNTDCAKVRPSELSNLLTRHAHIANSARTRLAFQALTPHISLSAYKRAKVYTRQTRALCVFSPARHATRLPEWLSKFLF